MASSFTQMTQVTQPATPMSPPLPSLTGTVPPNPLGPTIYTISGVKVEFPTKAYPSQIAMMHHVIQGLKGKTNCLLESPTGSGKTLALLCAALAWQRHEWIRVEEHNAAIDANCAAAMERNERMGAERRRDKQKSQEGSNNGTPVKAETQLSVNGSENSEYFTANSSAVTYDLTDDEDDFRPTKKAKSEEAQLTIYDCDGVAEAGSRPSSSGDGTSDKKTDKPYFVPPEKKLVVPKIYFGTRTHKQIAQITRELRKTVYKAIRSAVLASREHTCINPMLEGVPNKNEHCRELLDSSTETGEGCLYHAGARKFGSFGSLEHYGVLPGYDLEDLVKAGKTAKACPYYATRSLMQNADIIFCPYNYIIDPNIRKSMNINLDNAVVIFDEAHNMEDVSRDAASFTIKQHELTRAMQDCEKVKNVGGAEPYALAEMAEMLSTFSVWIDEQSSQLKDISYNTSGKNWTGTEVIASLQHSGFEEAKKAFTAIMAQRDRDLEMMKERGLSLRLEKPTILTATIGVIESILRLFEEMLKNHGRNRDDFRIALIKSNEKRRRDGQTGPLVSLVTFTLNIWCLNPAVAFSAIRDTVHNIVLTSGTLSPMQSFQSELGTPFQHQLEAKHVIDNNQIWAGVLGSGPTGVSLNASYQNAESFAFQDEVGAVVQYVCDTMPHGVLCFFPSYRMLDKMVERWQVTNRYRKLEEKKMIVVEPRTGASDFETAISSFYYAINNCDDEGEMGGQTGALFLAVCRGKVSEGVDFADNNARAVICIGIPFPNYRDMQVELKRSYNQQNIKRGLLSGSEWYEIQAFRALNQALGRCIRHKQDWGAILLIDDRYIKTPRYIQSLSKWIRAYVQKFQQFNPIKNSLECFRDEMLSRPNQASASSFALQWEALSQKGISSFPSTAEMPENGTLPPRTSSRIVRPSLLGPEEDSSDEEMK